MWLYVFIISGATCPTCAWITRSGSPFSASVVIACGGREIMGWVVTGLLNKQIAGELAISEITVKAHRGQVMRKMRAGSLADLVRMAARLEIHPNASR
jgi:DNA-binding CsgD family transcriptional regulator